MLIYNIPNTSKIHEAVTNNLRTLGVKPRIKRNTIKFDKNQTERVNKVFSISLCRQKFENTKLSNGGTINIPIFVKQTVGYLSLHLNQEGLFRKAGSQTRQKELVARFDNGNELVDKYNAIDVANCLKKYLRDLPESLIPNEFHDLFVRCGLLKFCKIEAILKVCLLLPTKHLMTLRYLMDFFKRVSMHEEMNKMGIENLAKVIGPNIMPVRETTMAAVQNRLNAHLTIVKILIENARKIGVLPKEILETVMSETQPSPATDLDHSGSSFKQKKKKHRSGSLTRMFNGLKKIVGKNGSPEDPLPRRSLLPDLSPSKSTKKRKNLEPAPNPPLTTKKKRESTPRTLFPSPVSEDPNPTDEKPQKDKSRRLGLHLDRFVSKNRHKIDPETDSNPQPMIERRWSMASGPSRASKKRNPKKSSVTSLVDTRTKHSIIEDYDHIFMEADYNLSDESPENAQEPMIIDSEVEEYVKIPKSEYEEIKNRMSAIESRIHQELDTIDFANRMDCASEVQSKYERTFAEASIDSITPADQLAKRLGKELKIRKASEGKVIRSPSARKIGNIRRRSQEKPISKKRLSRAASWHISEKPLDVAANSVDYSQVESDLCSEETNKRLDYLHQQLCTLISHTAEHTRSSITYRHVSSMDNKLRDTQAEQMLPKVRRASSFHGNEAEEKYYNTRMSNLKKTNSQRIAASSQENDKLDNLEFVREKDIFTWENACVYLKSENPTSLLLRKTSPAIAQTGRASVAKLRAQNAGMVLAKAKLFDDCKNVEERQQRRSKEKTPPSAKIERVERKKKCKSPREGRARGTGGDFSLCCDQENSGGGNEAAAASAHYKTPHIKKQLAVRTPKSARSLVRRAPVDTKRTPLKAVPVGTPKRQSPRNAFKAKQVMRNINID